MKPSNLRPFFAYLSESQYAALKQFAKQTGVSMTHLILSMPVLPGLVRG